MSWIGGKKDAERFALAVRETLRSAPPRPRGRRKATMMSSGMMRVSIYITPNEAAAARELAAEEGLTLSQAFRTLIRCYRQVEVDTEEDR